MSASNDTYNGPFNCTIWGNSTFLNEVINHGLYDHTINVTALVENCGDGGGEVCDLAWGTPNPDLSGIGACLFPLDYLVRSSELILTAMPSRL